MNYKYRRNFGWNALVFLDWKNTALHHVHFVISVAVCFVSL